MKVQPLMTTDVGTCRPDTNLAAVAHLMWDKDCGFIPVVDAAGTVIGVVTDRDICNAAATRRMLPEHIAAREAMRSPVYTCQSHDTIAAVLAQMKTARVRRLPVVDKTGALKGVISMNDIVLAAANKGIAPAAIVSTLAAILRAPGAGRGRRLGAGVIRAGSRRGCLPVSVRQAMTRLLFLDLYWRAALVLARWGARSWFDEVGRHHHSA